MGIYCERSVCGSDSEVFAASVGGVCGVEQFADHQLMFQHRYFPLSRRARGGHLYSDWRVVYNRATGIDSSYATVVSVFSWTVDVSDGLEDKLQEWNVADVACADSGFGDASSWRGR